MKVALILGFAMIAMGRLVTACESPEETQSKYHFVCSSIGWSLRCENVEVVCYRDNGIWCYKK